MARLTTIVLPARFWKRSLTAALTWDVPTDLGSWTKAWPDLLPGGRAPVTEYLRALGSEQVVKEQKNI